MYEELNTIIDILKMTFDVDIEEIKLVDNNFIVADNGKAFFLGNKIENCSFDYINKQVNKDEIKQLYIWKANFQEDLNIDLKQSLVGIKEINFKFCNFNNLKMYNPNNVKIVFNHATCKTIIMQDYADFNGSNVSLELNDVVVEKNLILNINKFSKFISKGLEIGINAYFKSNFIDELVLQDTLFNGIASFNGSSFKKIPDFSSTIFKDTKQVYFDYTSLEHISKATLEEQVSENIKNNYDKKDYESIIKDLEIKKQNANKLQSSLRLLKDIAITQNNKIYAKECEKLELFAYEIYLKAERDMKSNEFLRYKDKSEQKINAARVMWKAALEQSMLKFYEITSEHHTNFARIINFTLAVIFSLYLELLIVNLFSLFNIGYFNHIFNNFFSFGIVLYFVFLSLFVCGVGIAEKPKNKFIFFILMILAIILFIFPNYLMLVYLVILFILFLLFKLKTDTIHHLIGLSAIVCFACFMIFSKNIITSPSIYYLDDTLNKYTQEDIRNALKIASVENQEKINKIKKDSESKKEPKEESKPSQNTINLQATISQNQISSNISINQAQEPYDLFFGTNVVNLPTKNAQNIQDIKQFIKDNRLLMYYTSVKSSNETYNDIIKAIWIDLQLDTIYFIFFIIMILCIYSMQKTFRKNTI